MVKKITVYNKIVTLSDRSLQQAGVDPSINLASDDDIEAILSIEQQAFDPLLYDSLLTRKSLRHLISKGNAVVLVYFNAGEVAGYAQINFHKCRSSARFFSLAVGKKYEGKGIAGALFKGVERTCKYLGAAKLILEIREDNRALRYRYGKLGYKPYRTVPNYYADGCGAVKMQQSL